MSDEACRINAFEIVVGGIPVARVLRGQTLSIGRSADNDVVLEHPRISSFHASVTAVGAELLVTDLHSRNGTHVAGERVTAPVALQDGQSARLGGAVLVDVRGLALPASGPREEVTTQVSVAGDAWRLHSALFPSPTASFRDAGGDEVLRLRGYGAELVFHLQHARGNRPTGCPAGTGWISVRQLRANLWGRVRPSSNRFNQLLSRTRATLRDADVPFELERVEGGNLWDGEDGGWMRLSS